MAKSLLGKNEILLGADGFLSNIESWDEGVAKEIAKREGIEDLSAEKMAIVQFLRSYYFKFHAFPIRNYVCKNIDQPRECMDTEFHNPMTAWKIAGLPEPSALQWVSMDGGKHYTAEDC